MMNELKNKLANKIAGNFKKNRGYRINLSLAFIIGFCQFFFSIILEAMSLLYLTALTSPVFILVCYGTIATVA